MRVTATDADGRYLAVYCWTGERMEYLPARGLDTDEGWVEVFVMTRNHVLYVDGDAILTKLFIPFYVLDKRDGSVMRPDGSIIKTRHHEDGWLQEAP